MEKIKIEKSDLEKINKQLHKGDKVRIAEMTGLSASTVRKVFMGHVINFDVIEKAVLLLEKRKKALEQVRRM